VGEPDEAKDGHKHDHENPEDLLHALSLSGFTATNIARELLKWFFLRKNHANILRSCKDLR
jgi:hypothetical protein